MADGLEAIDHDTIANAVLAASESSTSAILFNTFLFDTSLTHRQEWPSDTHLLSSSDTQSGTIKHDVRDAMGEFTSALFSKFNLLCSKIRERSSFQTPFDPASELIAFKPLKTSSFALEDAQVAPAPSPSPGTERTHRFSAGVLPPLNSERAKMQTHGRACKVCGDFLLICGFCNEALKQYAEAAAIARANNDYLWYGAALEGIGVCLVLFAYLELNVQIPSVALSATTVAQRPNRADERLSTSSNRTDVILIDFLPDLHSTIIDLYQKSTNVQGDQVPPFVLAESSLRIAKLLSAAHIAGGLNRTALRHVVIGSQLGPLDGRFSAVYPPRAEIAAWAMRAYQGPIDSLSLADKLHIFSGLASILGAIKFNRRRALFLREIVTALIPALVQARVAGAAGMGIHPAASLAMSENTTFSREVLMKTRQSANSLSSLLQSLAASFGIPDTSNLMDMEDCLLSGYGWPELQSIVLRDCIAISEAIPDFEGVLQYSKRSLELISALMGRDDQVRMVSNIPRIVGAAKRLGVLDLDVEYWDQYLVRDITISTKGASTPIKRRTQELLAIDRAGSQKDPFLYNPYAKKSSEEIQTMIVENEPVSVSVSLQNPFEFDIEAQSIQLIAQGVPFQDSAGQTFVKALSSQVVTIPITAKAAGRLKISGCKIKVTGCRTSIFQIRQAPSTSDISGWQLRHGGISRTKRFGMDANTAMTPNQHKSNLVDAQEVSLLVLPASPTLTLRSLERQTITSISLLEGETSTLTIKLHNESPVPVTFITFSFTDSTTKPLEIAINSRNKQPHEIYELETFLYNRKALLYEASNQSNRIEGNSASSFMITVRGKRGFNTGELTINYGHLPVPSTSDNESVVPEDFYTRQLVVPLKAVVTPAIDVVHCDVVPIPSGVASFATTQPELNKQFLAMKDAISNVDEYCLVLLDFRNVHSSELTMSLTLSEQVSELSVRDVIPSGSQRRIVLPFRRIKLSSERAITPIPSLSNRQFVVSSGTGSETFPLEMFWAREELLSRLHLSWSTHDRSGEIEKRAIAINKRMLKALLIDSLRISLQCDEKDCHRTDEEFSVELSITNDTPDKILVFVRVQITLASTGDPEGGKRLILQGLSQYPIIVKAKSSHQENLRLMGMNSGRYKVGASLEVMDGQSAGDICLARELEISVVD